jgi:hypothetical protein
MTKGLRETEELAFELFSGRLREWLDWAVWPVEPDGVSGQMGVGLPSA